MFLNSELRQKLECNPCISKQHKMLLKFIPILFTDKLPESFAGYFQCYWIKIRPKYKDDIGLLIHELTHFKQFLKLPVIYCYYRQFSADYRYKCELEAYSEQLVYNLCKTFRQLKIEKPLSIELQLTPDTIEQLDELKQYLDYLVDVFANFMAADKLNKYKLPLKAKYCYTSVANDLRRKVYELLRKRQIE